MSKPLAVSGLNPTKQRVKLDYRALAKLSLQLNRRRVRLVKHEWSPAIQGWTVKYLRANYWRVDTTLYDFEDLLQEARMVYYKVVWKYPLVTEPKHMMALYKRSLSNYICDLSRYKQRKDNCHQQLPVDALDLADALSEDNHEGYLNLLLDEAPEELKLILEAFGDQSFLEELRKSTKRRTLEPRENLNQQLRRILKIEGSFDFVGTLKTLLSNQK